ncbi:SDR family NAD(P)-dependent oxidoreductase [Solwaraspora sp. WMMD406]|uniref:SDR family NAD(P)-dependent oxidoreductase n=1 Tax=Solwaraspora sp. WMMD406 TaxID=3016095 RepID=UPI002416BDFD|nr:SDR family NAD(P)-dependent oxidoreductase [Solwaraspora sp. WMMD406]MDG4763011.1 SDR family NAD(P)-dependent oxidoreductase [Solwaraspora sp. WMMD406]
MRFDLTDRRALVTGAGHGIGAAVARRLAAAGADVVVHHGHSGEEAARVVAEIEQLGGRATALQADLTDGPRTSAMVDAAAAFLGGLDIVVANAGQLVARVSMAQLTEDHWQAVLDVNLTATYRTVRAALPYLRAAGRGRIITMAAQAGHDGGGPGEAAYAAAKAGVIGFTKALAKEFGADGITANALAPGFVSGTAFHRDVTMPKLRDRIIRRVPAERAGEPQDVAGAVAFLSSDAAGYLTGATIDIGGAAWPR